MTTIVVHGTKPLPGQRETAWWRASWNDGGFLHALAGGLAEAGVEPDVWRARGRALTQHPELPSQRSVESGLFAWSGVNMSLERTAGGDALARYLTALRGLTDEPLRIVAYGHGCNMVKAASASPHLAAHVHIDRAVFLGCPHIVARSQVGPILAYRLAAERVGKVLNLHCPEDTSLLSLPNTVMGPPTARWMAWVPPQAEPHDPDPDAAPVYEDCPVTLDAGATPAALHGAVAGRIAGLWLGLQQDVIAVTQAFKGAIPPLR